MRIRTVKPEFWANEKMSRMPEFTRLLALGLLNYADDHGYFWANPMLVRGALFPFDEDSGKVRRSLAHLVEEGFIRLGLTADGRECGHIINFGKHQRVDKPRHSDIQPLASFVEASKKHLGSVDDKLPLDRGSGIGDRGSERIGDHILSASPVKSVAKTEPSSISAPIEEEIYSAYPKKVGKTAALKSIRKALDANPLWRETMLGKVREYAAAVALWPEEDWKYVPDPSTWFNKGKFEDDPKTWVRKAPPDAGYVSSEPSNLR